LLVREATHHHARVHSHLAWHHVSALHHKLLLLELRWINTHVELRLLLSLINSTYYLLLVLCLSLRDKIKHQFQKMVNFKLKLGFKCKLEEFNELTNFVKMMVISLVPHGITSYSNTLKSIFQHFQISNISRVFLNVFINCLE